MDGRTRSFIEEQFPVSRLSKESYKERKAGSGQTLTGLGKWWGRKPLVLVRALILGSLLPASDSPEKDREVFLRLMTMDPDGLWERKLAAGKRLSVARVVELLADIHDADPLRIELATAIVDGRWVKGIDKALAERLERAAFTRMSTDEQLTLCQRPEELDGPSPESWAVINAHLGTSADSLTGIVEQLSERRFGHQLRVGDAFAGGGSIPFEAARLGAKAYAGDLNPVAVLLTWAALHIAGADAPTAARIRASQEQLLSELRTFVDSHDLETNVEGWRAEAYLYCNEVLDGRSGYLVPLAPSWVVSEKEGVYAELVPNKQGKRFDIVIKSGGSKDDLAKAKEEATWSGGLRSPLDANGKTLPIAQRTPVSGERLRGPQGLRRWENEDLVPRPDDVFQERLFAIRWRTPDGTRLYRAPDAADLAREAKVLELLHTHFADWQAQGFIPSAAIAAGEKTDEPIRTRGWTRWHHLFAPRQLLLHGYLSRRVAELKDVESWAAGVLTVGYLPGRESRLTGWGVPTAQVTATFSNQALNTTVLWPAAGTLLKEAWFDRPAGHVVTAPSEVVSVDARAFPFDVDLFITDPPYADMVNYEELTEFFTAWYAGHSAALANLIPGWGPDTLRELAIKGAGEDFRRSIAEAYQHLTTKMADDGIHIVTFTSQDIAVWRDLALILWSAGLQVTAVWTISTETTSGLKQGSYVQGTVCLVLRKRLAGGKGYLSDLESEISSGVHEQLSWMRQHDDADRPDFGDADLQLAAYGAALKALTRYDTIVGIDLAGLVAGHPGALGAAALDEIIERARSLASEELIPTGLDPLAWRESDPIERFYLKALDLDVGGEHKSFAYEQLARAFGVSSWQELFAERSANHFRVSAPSELADSLLRGHAFSGALLCRVLHAVSVAREQDSPTVGRDWLRDDLSGRYQGSRDRVRAYLRFFAARADQPTMPAWEHDRQVALRLERLIGSEEL